MSEKRAYSQRVQWTEAERVAVLEAALEASRNIPRVLPGWVKNNVARFTAAVLPESRQRKHLSWMECVHLAEWCNAHPSREGTHDAGRFGQLTVKQLVELVKELDDLQNSYRAERERMQAYSQEWGSSVWEDARCYRGQLSKSSPKSFPAEKTTVLRREREPIVIIGVQGRYRYDIQTAHPGCKIIWTENSDSEAMLGRRVSCMRAIVHRPGIPARFIPGLERQAFSLRATNSIHGVREELRAFLQGAAK